MFFKKKALVVAHSFRVELKHLKRDDYIFMCINNWKTLMKIDNFETKSLYILCLYIKHYLSQHKHLRSDGPACMVK